MAESLTDVWLESSIAKLQGHLSIYGDGHDCRGAMWRDAVGPMNPEEFFNTLTRDIPGQVSVSVESRGAGSSLLNITSHYGGKTLLSAENIMHRNPYQLEMRFDTWRIGRSQEEAKRLNQHIEPLRSKGVGTVLFDNVLKIMRPIGLRYIKLTCGHEDGPAYWGQRGFHIEEHGRYVSDFMNQVEKNYTALKSGISAETQTIIEDVIKNPTPYANIQLARIAGRIGDAKLNKQILHGANTRCIVDLDDAFQMSLVNLSLEHVPDLRLSLKDHFPIADMTAIPQRSCAQVSGQAPFLGFSTPFRH